MLTMHRITRDKALTLTDGVERSRPEPLSVVVGKEPGASILAVSQTARWGTNAECRFPFLPLFIKATLLSGFLPVRENRYQRGFSVKVRWGNANF